MKGWYTIAVLLCVSCATPSPYDHGPGDAPAPYSQPLAQPPGCVAGGGDTVATNRFFEFQVAKQATALDNASTGAPTTGPRVLVLFVVDTAGVPLDTTLRAVYAADTAGVRLVRSRVASLRFAPAEVGGCRVRQWVQRPVPVP